MLRLKVVCLVAAGMWDRMLGFLGFEEEVEEEDGALAAPLPAINSVGHGSAHGSVRDVERRRGGAVRQGRAAWGPVERAEHRGGAAASRSANVTRLVPAFPGFVVAAPKRFEESQEVADHLKGGKPVLLHLEGLERELAQRLINFLMGSVYALGGEMHRVGAAVLFVPAGVEVTLPLSLRMGEREGR